MADSDATFGQGAGAERSSRSVTKMELYQERLDVSVLTPLRVIWDDWRTRVGTLIIFAYLLMGTVGVMVIEVPRAGDAERLMVAFQDPNFILGTNNLGEGIFAKIVHSTPPILKMITSGAIFSTAIATIVGTVSGYKGGTVDRVLTTLSDIAMTIPGLPLFILISVIFNPRSPWVIGIVLSINAWAGLARAIRSQVLSLRDEAYVEASRIMGVSTGTIVKDDILPNIMPYVLINFVQSARGVIFAAVGLYYLGLLPNIGSSNWGVMLNSAYSTGGALYSLKSLHWLLFPMFAIVFISFGLVLFSQGTEQLFNPRIRARHADTIEDEAMPEEAH
jgi:peptide/nickel transport system permease protein